MIHPRQSLGGLLLLAAACVGQIGSPDPGDGPEQGPVDCDDGAVHIGSAALRRMNRFEYNNTVRDLLGDTTDPADAFSEDEEALGFNNNSSALTTSSALAEKYMRTSEQIASRALDAPESIVPCEVATGDDACADALIQSLGRRAFRRPLTSEQTAVLTSLYQIGKADGGFRLGVEMVIQGLLQSPHFLYRVELGTPVSDDDTLVRLDGYELASKLSYMLWGSMPDDALLDAAAAGELDDLEGIEVQARRLVADDKARGVIENFHEQWLDYFRIKSVGKDGTLFPDYSPAIGELMRQETAAFIDHVVFEGGGDLGTLLTADYTFVNAELAAFYGIEGPSPVGQGGDAFEMVSSSERAGLLSIGTLMTMNAHSNQTSIVHRGKMVREQLLCDMMPPPPDDVMITVPEPDPNSTAKERFAQHSSDPTCSGCHELLDPIGWGFENWDAVGRYREDENGLPLDTAGEIIESDVDGTFDGVVELGDKLAQSEDVQACYVAQWFRYGYGRGEVDEDACSVRLLEQASLAANGDIKELAVALTQTDAFLYKRVGGAQ